MRQRRDNAPARGRPRKFPAPLKPNHRRQVLLAGLAVLGLAAGYLVANFFGHHPEPVAVADHDRVAAPAPWYKTQGAPPALVTRPDVPIYPDANDKPPQAKERAYEEALPADVYVAAPPATMPPPAESPAVLPAVPPALKAPAVPAPAIGEPAWRRFALAAPDAGGRPMIAVVIDDMGLDRKRSARAVDLAGPLTLSFLTYADDLGGQTAAARAAGHELLLHISMEPTSRTIDPGPNVLLTGETPDEIRRRLTWGLDRASGYVGINNHMGSKFTGDGPAMAVVMEVLRSRGLLFLDSRTTPDSMGAREAHRAGVPVLERNVFLDNVNEVAAVNDRLAEVERIARHHGTAIAIGHPRDATLAALAAWIPHLKERGFVLVPLTAVLKAAMHPQARAG